MNAQINKPWVSLSLPIHMEFKNFCLVSVLKLVFKLQPLFDVVVTKEFMDGLCSVNMPPFSSTEVYMELVVGAPVDFIPNGLCAYLLGQLSSAVSP